MGGRDQTRSRPLRDGRRHAAGRQRGDEAGGVQASDQDPLCRLRVGSGRRCTMKVDELRVLEVDELDGRLRQARRELYELRFKHAVGQLENSRQISKARHDIARIMTVLRERDFGILASVAPDTLEPVTVPAAAEPVEAAEAPAAKPKRTRKKAEETSCPTPQPSQRPRHRARPTPAASGRCAW